MRMKLRAPKMILFDYGHTLLCEPGFDFSRGNRALYPYITKNSRQVTPEAFDGFSKEIFDQVVIPARAQGCEFHNTQYLRLVLEYLGIELSVSLEEAERIQWDAISQGAQMPHIEELLALLREQGIRSGVISNLLWSGRALTERIDRLLPENRFEFVIASSEYMLRKPSRYLFDLALRKAELTPKEVWFCGDNVEADVLGAHGAGIFPVWYCPEEKAAEQTPEVPHLKIRDWRELADILERVHHAS